MSCRAASEESGPKVTVSSSGSPSFSFLAAAMNRGRNLSSIDLTTMNLVAPMPVCPLFPNRPRIAMATVWSRSASSKTTNASLPPSSTVDFFRFFPARDASASPPRVVDQRPSLIVAQEQIGVDAFGYASLAKSLCKDQCTLGNARRVFKKDHVARHQMRAGKTSQLIIRIVPGLNAEQDAER